MRPKAGTKGHAVNRLLRQRPGGFKGLRGTPQYHASFQRLPEWCDNLDVESLVGVYVNEAGPGWAILFFEDRVVLNDGDGKEREVLLYADVRRVLPFSKDPVARDIFVEDRRGRVVRVPAGGPEGDVSLLARVFVNVRP